MALTPPSCREDLPEPEAGEPRHHVIPRRILTVDFTPRCPNAMPLHAGRRPRGRQPVREQEPAPSGSNEPLARTNVECR